MRRHALSRAAHGHWINVPVSSLVLCFFLGHQDHFCTRDPADHTVVTREDTYLSFARSAQLHCGHCVSKHDPPNTLANTMTCSVLRCAHLLIWANSDRRRLSLSQPGACVPNFLAFPIFFSVSIYRTIIAVVLVSSCVVPWSMCRKHQITTAPMRRASSLRRQMRNNASTQSCILR